MNQSENIDTPNVQHEVADPAVMAITPLVSVKMITYNHGFYLAEAIEGVIAQITDFPIELVIAEDCSTDNTREIALGYQRRYPQLIRVIYSDRNVGMMANSKRAMAACRGEFIAICEGDDYWIDPDKLREQVAALTKFKDVDLAFHSSYLKYEKQNKKILSYVRSPTDKVFTLSEVITGRGDFMPSASLFVRRSLMMSAQDWMDTTNPPVGDFFIQVFGARNGGACYINKPMSVYRKEVDGAWTTTTDKSIDTVVEFETKFLSALKKLGQAIPRQEEAFRRHILVHYTYRFLTVNNENFTRIREVMLPVLEYLYTPEAIDGRLEDECLSKFAVDSGNAVESEDWKCGVSRQFLRVGKSLIAYGGSVMDMINNNRSGSSGYEKRVAQWKVQAQKSFLIARWQRLCRLIIGNR